VQVLVTKMIRHCVLCY